MSKELVKFDELVKDKEIAIKNDKLKVLLNKSPHDSWLVPGPPGTPPSWKDIPIDKVEWLLDAIFQKWKVEILDVKQIMNSIVTTVRLHYQDPVSGEWLFHDGVGAKDVQVDAGAKPTEFDKIKKAGVMMAAPASKTYAIKDAADHIGEIFGRSLNRKNVKEFKGFYDKEEVKQPDPSQQTDNYQL